MLSDLRNSFDKTVFVALRPWLSIVLGWGLVFYDLQKWVLKQRWRERKARALCTRTLVLRVHGQAASTPWLLKLVRNGDCQTRSLKVRVLTRPEVIWSIFQFGWTGGHLAFWGHRLAQWRASVFLYMTISDAWCLHGTVFTNDYDRQMHSLSLLVFLLAEKASEVLSPHWG